MSTVLEMPPSTKKTSLNSKKKFFPLFIIVVVLFLMAACFFLYQGRIVNIQHRISPVVIHITSPLSVAFTEVFVEHGSQVEQGSLLARLDVSTYTNHLAHANALVRGALPQTAPSEVQQAQIIEKAQSAEADMVQRVALARQEEQAKHDLMEKLSVIHARSLLHLRGMQTQTDSAKQTEQHAKLQLEQARAAHEYASRNRASIENVLHKLRAQRMAQGFSMVPQDGMHMEHIVDQITAPATGYIVGNVPMAGDVVQKDTIAFSLLPSTNTQLQAVAQIPQEEAVPLFIQGPVYLATPNALLEGNIQKIIHDSPVSLVTVTLNAQGENFETLMKSTEENKSTLVFWPQKWVQKYIPNMALRILSSW